VQHPLICQPKRALLGWLGKAPAVTANLASRRCLDSSTASIFFIIKKWSSTLFVLDKNICQEDILSVQSYAHIRKKTAKNKISEVNSKDLSLRFIILLSYTPWFIKHNVQDHSSHVRGYFFFGGSSLDSLYSTAFRASKYSLDKKRCISSLSISSANLSFIISRIS
jgi:hypothetical protein